MRQKKSLKFTNFFLLKFQRIIQIHGRPMKPASFFSSQLAKVIEARLFPSWIGCFDRDKRVLSERKAEWFNEYVNEGCEIFMMMWWRWPMNVMDDTDDRKNTKQNDLYKKTATTTTTQQQQQRQHWVNMKKMHRINVISWTSSMKCIQMENKQKIVILIPKEGNEMEMKGKKPNSSKSPEENTKGPGTIWEKMRFGTSHTQKIIVNQMKLPKLTGFSFVFSSYQIYFLVFCCDIVFCVWFKTCAQDLFQTNLSLPLHRAVEAVTELNKRFFY